jgi:NDP-sugar pyrophosphorylase family protein
VENELINGDALTNTDFLPSYFFSFEHFEHSDLFDQKRAAHEALLGLKERKWTGKILIAIPENVVILQKQWVTIEEGVRIDPYACIEGPCYIGKGCHIGHAAYIRPYTFLCAGSVVGHASEVKGSIFFPEAKASHLCFVGDSILGRGVNLGAGTKCANFRFDEKGVSFWRNGVKLSTNERKMGSIIGDFAKTGCNVVLEPGTILEKYGRRVAAD